LELIRDEAGATRADISIWPRYGTAYGLGSTGLLWAARKFSITYEQAQDEYGYEKEGMKPTDTVEIIDWWDTQNNAIMVDGKERAKPPTPNGQSFCPVFRINVGTCPEIIMDTDKDALSNQGQSIFETTATLSENRNRLYSDILTLIHRNVKQPLVSETQDGERVLDADVLQVNKTAEIPLKLGEKIYPLLPQQMPPDAGTMLGIISEESEKGGFSSLSWGQTRRGLSGYAVNLLQAADGSTLMPFIVALQHAYQTICDTIIKQFGAGSWPSVRVRGRNNKGKQFGYPKLVEIKPADIDPEWLPEITIEAIFPRDDAQRVQIASILHQSKMMSLRHIWTKHLGVDDPDAERQQMNKEFGYELPTVKLWLAYIEAMDAEDYDLAANILVEARKITQLNEPPTEQAGQNPAMGGALNAPPSPMPNQAMGAFEQMAMQEGGGIPPSGMQGMSSNVMPSELMGGMPGGAMG
jgi:hypothetical protein